MHLAVAYSQILKIFNLNLVHINVDNLGSMDNIHSISKLWPSSEEHIGMKS